jgi:hypothetical protein
MKYIDPNSKIHNLNIYDSYKWKLCIYLLSFFYYSYFNFLTLSFDKNRKKYLKIKDINDEILLFDDLATRLGAAYRGAGILVGILSSLILLCAFSPMCFELNYDIKLKLSILEVALMLFSLLIIWAIRASELKLRWLDIRSTTEKLRYKQLTNLITHTKGNKLKYSELLFEINSLLDGSSKCQIEYNNRRLSEYENMEIFTKKLTYAGFIISFLAATIHIKFHFTELFLLTAFLPSCIGVMHAINGFLRLPQMVAYHGEMVGNLSEIKTEVLSIGSDEQSDQLVRLGQRLLRYLENINERWYGIAKHQDLHLV